MFEGKSGQDTETLVMHTDGGARGNPGPAGIGIVLWLERNGSLHHLEDIKRFIGKTTNNFAEYTALVVGLERAAELGHKKINCFLDSELVVRQLNGQYKIKELTLKPLAEKVFALKRKFEAVTFTHVPREKNVEADKLVNQAIDQAEAAGR